MSSVLWWVRAGCALTLIVAAICLVACSRSTPKPVADLHSQKGDSGDGIPPEVVQVEKVDINSTGVKTLIMGDAQGHYELSCNSDQKTCVTPSPGKNYLLFKKASKWKFPKAKDYVTLEWIQNWTGSYPDRENVALLPEDGGYPMGVYWFSSWKSSQ
jgi:hypothetical protein